MITHAANRSKVVRKLGLDSEVAISIVENPGAEAEAEAEALSYSID